MPPGGDYQTELRRLNRQLERAKDHREVVVNKNRMQVMERCRIDSADELIALPAAQVAFLIANRATRAREARRRCGVHALVPGSYKGHSRLLCSAAACGNRAKVAAFRERQRGSAV